MRTTRISVEVSGLHAAADECDDLHDWIVVPDAPADLPDLVTASRQLAALGGLLNDVSDEVLLRVTDDDPGIDLRPVIHTYASVSETVGQAMKNFTAAYAQLGFLHRFANAQDSPDLRDAREVAFHIARDRLDNTRRLLADTGTQLRRSAGQLVGGPHRIQAALSRSARSSEATNGTVQPAADRQPTRLAYTPSPRYVR